MHGFNTSPVRAHPDLFGVYGMLDIGLLLLSFRVIWVLSEWKEKDLRFSLRA